MTQGLSSDRTKRVVKALDEEEEDIYVMTLYFMSHKDLDYFSPPDKERIRQVLKILLEDTKHYAELLKLIVVIGSR